MPNVKNVIEGISALDMVRLDDLLGRLIVFIFQGLFLVLTLKVLKPKKSSILGKPGWLVGCPF